MRFVRVFKSKLVALCFSVTIILVFVSLYVLYDRALFSMKETPKQKHRRTSNRVDLPKRTRRLPQAIIIGAKKGGTRALLDMLNLHASIQAATKEVHFFDKDTNYQKGLKWYIKQMPQSSQDQITIEKSPAYFITPAVPERVKAMNASTKLLLIVREPVTRAISDYTHVRGKSADKLIRRKKKVTTKDGVTPSPLVYPTFEELALLPDGSINETYIPLIVSTYHLHLHRWLEVFPREQILIVNGDRLIKDPVSQLTPIETFLGIEHRITRDNFYFNATKGFYCLRKESGDQCLSPTKGREHPDVDQSVISKLRRYFADHNQKFYELIDEDFGWPEE